MNIGTPQLIVIVLWTISLSVNLAKNGEVRVGPGGDPDRYSIGRDLVRVAIWAPLLYWGGFFR